MRNRRQLIQDLQEGDAEALRAATLQAGRRILRRRRHWRIARKTLGVSIVVLILAVALPRFVHVTPTRPGPAQIAASIAPEPQRSKIRSLTDDELLALFPDTPVGLAKLKDGKKRLIFPRPEDDVRFIKRL